MGRRIAYAALGLLATLIVLLAAVVLLLGRFDLSGIAAARATAAVGRPVSVGALHIAPGWWVHFDLEDVHVPNIPGGTQPEMIGLKRLEAEIEARSLLRGAAAVRHLEINGLTMLLERAADGTPNWRPSEGPGDRPAPPTTPQDRSGFPLLLDVAVHGSVVTDRTSKGHILPVGLDDATLRTSGPDAPVRLEITGSYRGIPTRLTADLQSTAVLRQGSQPYGTDIQITAKDTALRFQGTMTRPLAADGADGSLTLHAPTLTTLLQAFGVQSDDAGALDLTGKLTRSDTLWVLSGASGTLSGSSFAASTLRLLDRGRGRPNDIDLDLAFDRLELDKLLPRQTGGPEGFSVDRDPDPRLRAKLTARQLIYRGNEAADVRVAADIEPGRIEVDDLAMKAFGASLQASAHAEAAGKGNRVTAEASVLGADLQQLRRVIGARDVPMTGRLDAQLAADYAGPGDPSLDTAHIVAVISMREGSIARNIVEKASLDIRSLFRAPKGMVAITCMLGVFDVQAGQGTVSPLRIRTAAGTIAGQGRFDLNRRQIDVTIGSEAATTSAFALDVPLRISGPIGDPAIRPSSAQPTLATANLTQLPPRLSQAARQNPCLSR